MVDQHLALVRLGELAAHHLPVAAVRAQDLHVAPGTAARLTSPFRGRTRPRRPDGDDRLLDAPSQAAELELRAVEQHAEVVQVRAVVGAALEARRHLLDDGQPEVLEHRQQRRERHLAAGLDDPRQRVSALVRLLRLLVLQPDGERLAGEHALEQARRAARARSGCGRGLVVVGEALG